MTANDQALAKLWHLMLSPPDADAIKDEKINCNCKSQLMNGQAESKRTIVINC